MIWITNHPKSVKGLWPRRAGCEYIEGEPKGRDPQFPVDALKNLGLVGIYVDMPEDEYRKLPIVKTPQELNAYLLANRKVE